MTILFRSIFLPLSLVTSSSPQFWEELQQHVVVEDHKQEQEHAAGSSNSRYFKARRLQESSMAVQNCQEDARRNEENLKNIGLRCKCQMVTGGVSLICVDECAYCNHNETVCGIRSPQAFYDTSSGNRTAVGGVFEYYYGVDGALAVENLECVEDDEGRVVECETCNAYANDVMCLSCEFQTCSDGRREEIMDCSNVEEGAMFDFCETVNVDTGIFQAFSTDHFDQCLPLSQVEAKASKKTSKKSSKKDGKGGKSTSKSSKKNQLWGKSKSANKMQSR